MNVRTFEPADLDRIDLQPAQQGFRTLAPNNFLAEFLSECCYTVEHEGAILACVTVLDHGDGLGEVLLFLSTHAARHMLRLTRLAKRFLEVTGKRTLIATCEADFMPGVRWLCLLGFEFVRFMPCHGIDRKDHLLFCKDVLP